MQIGDLYCLFGGALTGCKLPEIAAELFTKGAGAGAAAANFVTEADAKDVLNIICKTSPSVCMIPKVLRDIVSPFTFLKN